MQRAITTSLEWARELRPDDDLDPHEYRGGYLALLDLFATYVRPSKYRTVLAGANAVYGWMPTILKKLPIEDWEASKDALASLASASSWEAAKPTLRDQPGVMRLVNGSVVGTSKFLHFLNPNVFPIWDSNIRLCFAGAASLPLNRASSYLTYGDAFWGALSNSPAYSRAYLDFVGQGVSPVRRLELALFLHGRHLRDELRKQNVEEPGSEAG